MFAYFSRVLLFKKYFYSQRLHNKYIFLCCCLIILLPLFPSMTDVRKTGLH